MSDAQYADALAGVGKACQPTAEAHVLGALLQYGNDATPALELVRGDEFEHHRNGIVFGAIKRLHERGDPIDPTAISDELTLAGELDAAGGMQYLAELVDASPSAANIDYHCRIITDRAHQRWTETLLQKGLNDVRKCTNGLLGQTVADIVFGLQAIEHDVSGSRIELISVAEALRDPDALKLPEAVAPKIAFAGRTTLNAGREKLGKTTLLKAAAAAVSLGQRFLGEPTKPGRVVILQLEDHPSDTVRDLVAFGVDPESVFLVSRVTEPLSDLRAAVAEVEPVLVIIDTLAAFTAPLALDPWNAADWTPLLIGIAQIARDSGAGIVINHHGNKADGKYRDSTAIGAGVDAILEMSEGTELSVRKVQCRGRFPLEDFNWRLVREGERLRVELSTPEIPLVRRLYRFIEDKPGCTKTKIRDGVEGRSDDIDRAMWQLEAEGFIENRGSAHSHAWYAVRAPESPLGHRMGTGGAGSGQDSAAGRSEACPDGGLSPFRGSPSGTIADLHTSAAGDPWTTHELFEREANPPEGDV